MKVLIVHNAYQQRGGEDMVVAAEQALLQGAGHIVRVEIVSNDRLTSLTAKSRAFLNAHHDAGRKIWVQELICRYRPDVLHVHNFFPLLTPAIHMGASQAGVAVVQTLHNYRLICAGAQLMREGRVCEKCVAGTRFWGVVHRCYRKSLAGSIAVVRMQADAARMDTWRQYVHRFIALTEFARDKFVTGGLPPDRVVVKPNFTKPGMRSNSAPRNGVLYAGRLSPEKGVDVLIEAWKRLPSVPLTIVGDGPERMRLESSAPPHVRFLGYRDSDDVRRFMTQAQVLVMPSVWYEGFPLTLVEAFAAGVPVVGSRLGAMAELIVDGETGFHFTSGDPRDLADAVLRALSDPARLEAMSARVRETHGRLYSPERNLELLERIYLDALHEAHSGG